MNFLTGIGATSSALQAEKTRMDIVSQNIANAHTTKGLDGKPYQRKLVTFESCLQATGGTGVKIAQIDNDQTPGEMVHNPQHPHANKDGWVEMPNVNEAMEMVDLVSSSRAYEANLAVVRNARQMAIKALSIGK